jgi:cell division protein FtsL
MRRFASLAGVVKDLFERRVRGVRVVEAGGFACLVVLVLGVYFSKAGAGAEGAQIADTTRQIAAEQQRVRLLRAELSRLEAPERLERLSTQYLGMAPASAKQEAAPDALANLAHPAAPR